MLILLMMVTTIRLFFHIMNPSLSVLNTQWKNRHINQYAASIAVNEIKRNEAESKTDRADRQN